MEKFNISYSTKNIPSPSRSDYLQRLIEKTEQLLRKSSPRGSRSCQLLNSFNGTSLAVSHWKLRMDTYDWVSIQPKQAILRTGPTLKSSSAEFTVSACSVAYAPLDLMTVGEERWMYTSTLRVSVYIHRSSPTLRGIVVLVFTKSDG